MEKWQQKLEEEFEAVREAFLPDLQHHYFLLFLVLIFVHWNSSKFKLKVGQLIYDGLWYCIVAANEMFGLDC